jgi:hypothetical protein
MVSPNPFTNTVNVTLKQSKGKGISFLLLDNFGHIILTQTGIADGNNQTFTLYLTSNVAPGNYILMITSDEKFASRYLVKK